MSKTVAELEMAIAQFVANVEAVDPFPICEDKILIAKRFYKHLGTEFSQENFNFLAAVAHYSETSANLAANFCPPTIKSLVPKSEVCAAAIWNQFVKPGAATQVNLPSPKVNEVTQTFNGTAFVVGVAAQKIATVFTQCAAEIIALIRKDSWPRFKKAWKEQLEAALVDAKKAEQQQQALGTANRAAGLAKAKPILAKLRSHQKTKLTGSFLGLRGKHPSGKFVLFPKSLDGVPTLLTSSAVDKEVDPQYVAAASSASSTVFPALKGHWLRHMGANKVETYWVEDSPVGTAQLFGQALTNMGINTPIRAVSLALLQAELQVKQPVKAAAMKGLVKPLALILSAEAGVVDRTKVWGLAKPNAKKAIPEAIFVVVEREFTASKLTEALTKVAKGNWPVGAYADATNTKPLKHWVVVHSSPDADRDPKMFGGVWLYKGVTKPILTGVGQFVGKQQTALPPGWLVVVTQAEAKAALDAAFAKKQDEMIRAQLAATGLV